MSAIYLTVSTISAMSLVEKKSRRVSESERNEWTFFVACSGFAKMNFEDYAIAGSPKRYVVSIRHFFVKPKYSSKCLNKAMSLPANR